jgi:KaiC/GvpD/RAD55 family RecA-like ATPase
MATVGVPHPDEGADGITCDNGGTRVKRVSRPLGAMDRIPFGVSQLDRTINGGAPTGSVVLCSGEAGAGAREFVHTSAIMNGLGESDAELYDLYYGDMAADATPPEEVHYVSLTADRNQLVDEMHVAMDEEVVDAGLEAVEFHDLSERYFHVSPVPRSWYTDETTDITQLRDRQDRTNLITALAETLGDIAPNNLVVLDSLTDIIASLGESVDWRDNAYVTKGLQKAAHEWGGLVLLHLNHETLAATRLGQLGDAVNGTMRFEWESGGSTRARTLVVKQFRGVLSQIEAENIVRFETEIGEAGFDISDVRKIR